VVATIVAAAMPVVLRTLNVLFIMEPPGHSPLMMKTRGETLGAL